MRCGGIHTHCKVPLCKYPPRCRHVIRRSRYNGTKESIITPATEKEAKNQQDRRKINDWSNEKRGNTKGG